jgi:hypothetical protein
MTEHDEQLEHLREAVDRKSAEARDASEATQHDHPRRGPAEEGRPTQEARYEAGRPQDVFSPRDKNSGKGKKTADKWNQ